jgi:flagellar protein FliO/FliZ
MAFAARFSALSAGALLLWGGLSALGQEQAVPASPPEKQTVVAPVSAPVPSGTSGVTGGATVSLLGYVLTIVVLGAAGFTVLLRGGFFGVSWGAAKTARKLRIEESRTVGNRQHLVVAEYEGRRVLLGISPGRIDYLCGLDTEGSGSGGGFSDALSEATSGALSAPEGARKDGSLIEGKQEGK